MKYCSDIKRNKILSFVAIQMDLEDMFSQAQRDKCLMFLLMSVG